MGLSYLAYATSPWFGPPNMKSVRVRTVRSSDCKENHPMPESTVKWFNAQKGYGFIQPSDEPKDVFVRVLVVEGAGHSGLNERHTVSFAMERGH